MQLAHPALNKRANLCSNALPWVGALLLGALQAACDSGGNAVNDRPLDTGNNFRISAPVVDVDFSTPLPPVAVGSPAGTAVGITAFASDEDPDNNQVSYELLEGASGLFAINANSGVVATSGVLTAAALSAPATVATYSIIVKAVSADGSSSQGAFTVRVEPANTAPVGAIADADAGAPAFTFGQVSDDDPAGVTAQAADPDTFQAVSYTLVDNAGGLFGIDESSGEIRFLMVPATAPSEATTLSVTVKATSTDGSSSTATFDITLLPASTPPPPAGSPISSPVVDVDLSTPVPPLAVGSPAGTAVGITAFASDPDPDNNQVSYELLEDASMLFAIDANSGVVTTSGVLTTAALSAPATVTTHSITVQAVSADGSSSQGIFTVRVEPANTAPVGAIADADPAMAAIAFNQVFVGEPVGVTAQAADPDAFQAVSYTLADNAGGLFGIDESSGEIRFLVVPATAPSEATTLSVTVKATSTDGSSSTATFDITLLPPSDAPDLIVHFPAPLSLTTTNTISFFGTAAPRVDGAGPVTVTVTVGDAETVTRAATAEPFAWQVEDLPLNTNQTVTVAITAQDAMGRHSQREYRVVQSSATVVVLVAPVGLVLDAANDRLLVADNNLDGIIAVDLSDGPNKGLRTRFSTDGDGNGPEMNTPSGAMALDSANNRVLLMDSTLEALFAVDLTTGERSVLSDDTNDGTGFKSSAGLALHPTKPNVALVSDGSSNDVVFEVDLVTGERTVLSPKEDPAIGSWNTPRDIIAWTDTPFALVPTSSDRALFSVNLETGGRAVVSSASTGTGPDFGTPRFMALRGTSHANRLLITDSGILDALLSVNLETGDRELLSGSSGVGAQKVLVGAGNDFSDPRGIALDDGNDIAYVADAGSKTVVIVDLTTGDREELAPPEPPRTLAAGPQLINPRSIALDRSTQPPRLLVVDDGLNAVMEVSLATGERNTISEPRPAARHVLGHAGVPSGIRPTQGLGTGPGQATRAGGGFRAQRLAGGRLATGRHTGRPQRDLREPARRGELRRPARARGAAGRRHGLGRRHAQRHLVPHQLGHRRSQRASHRSGEIGRHPKRGGGPLREPGAHRHHRVRCRRHGARRRDRHLARRRRADLVGHADRRQEPGDDQSDRHRMGHRQRAQPPAGDGRRPGRADRAGPGHLGAHNSQRGRHAQIQKRQQRAGGGLGKQPGLGDIPRQPPNRDDPLADRRPSHRFGMSRAVRRPSMPRARSPGRRGVWRAGLEPVLGRRRPASHSSKSSPSP